MKKEFQDLAVEYAYAVIKKTALHSARRKIQCEDAYTDPEGGTQWCVQPCWAEHSDPSEYCTSCKRKQQIHEEFTVQSAICRSLFNKLKRVAKNEREMR